MWSELQNRNFPGRTVEEIRKEVDVLSIRESRSSIYGGNDDTVTVIITARGYTQREILARSRLFMGYRSCGVKEEAAPHGCFKCYALDHRIAECKVGSEI